MFERECMLNEFLIEGFRATVRDIPAERLYERAPGNGHPPVWVPGHLAICSELGQKLCGGAWAHQEWLRTFGPGSSDEIEDTGQFTKPQLTQIITEGYPVFAELTCKADESALAGPHGISLLEGLRVQTVGDVVAHLLTSHFAFHLAQLSGWRRAAGHAHLF